MHGFGNQHKIFVWKAQQTWKITTPDATSCYLINSAERNVDKILNTEREVFMKNNWEDCLSSVKYYNTSIKTEHWF